MKKLLLFGTLLLSTTLVALDVYKDSVTFTSLFWYLLSLVCCVLIFASPLKQISFKDFLFSKREEFVILVFLITLQLSFFVHLSIFPFHYVQDEFISAYTSFNLKIEHGFNWFAAFPEKGEWVNQFPSIFFVLQKPFLTLIGPSLEAIHISTWPYHIIIIIYLYLLANEYFKSRFISFLTILVYIFLAPNAYLSSLGTHFISSTLFFLAAFYYFLIAIKKSERRYFLLLGLFLSLCYLTYSASYLALPFLFLFALIEWLSQRSNRLPKLFIPTLVISIIILSPFIIYALTKNNFFLQRVDQVNFMWGSWGQTQERVQNGASLSSLLVEQIMTNIQSLYTANIGGINDYWFGNEPLFNPTTFFLLLVGCFYSLYQTIRGRRLFFYLLLILFGVFFFAMVLTIPPGAFHRAGIGFPFIAIMVVLAITFLSKTLSSITKLNHILFSLAIIIVFLFTNYLSLKTMFRKDETLGFLRDSVPISSYVLKEIPKGTNISIGAFPQYHLKRELFFRTHNLYTFQTNYLDSLLQTSENNILILHFPKESQVIELRKSSPDGKIVDMVDGVQLKHHLIFIPNPKIQNE